MNRELLQLALDALKSNHKWHEDHDEYGGYVESDLAYDNTAAIAALKAELAKPEPEPFGWFSKHWGGSFIYHGTFIRKKCADGYFPLYRHPKPTIPDGWKLAPIEPTQEILSAMYVADDSKMEGLARMYKAGLAAAPEYREASTRSE